MSWMDWGVVGGIISLVALLLFFILTLYAGLKGSSPGSKRQDVSTKPEPLIERRTA
jgi:hypothetical protein